MTGHLAGGLPASLFSLDNQPCGPILLDTRIEVQEIFSLALRHPRQPFDRSSIEMRLSRIAADVICHNRLYRALGPGKGAPSGGEWSSS